MSLWNWLNARRANCPLSPYMGVTLYGTLDVNATLFETTASPDNPSMDKLFYDIQKPASVQPDDVRL